MWLSKIENAMKLNLSMLMQQCLKAFTEMDREEWLFSFPAQCVATVEQIVWTHNVASALEAIEDGDDKDALLDYRDFFLSQLNSMLPLIGKQKSIAQHTTLSAILVLGVHLRDVLNQLIEDKCSKINDFDWTRQLRYIQLYSIVYNYL